MAVGTEREVEEEIRYRITALEFFRAVDADIFPDEARIFLGNGRILTKRARSLTHAATAEILRSALATVIPDGWAFWGENPIHSQEFSAPLPDLCLIRGSPNDYFRRGSYPRAVEIALVVEIAESSPRAGAR